jgi:hypothetical protein
MIWLKNCSLGVKQQSLTHPKLDDGIAGRGLRQAYKGSGVKLFMSFQPSPS